MMNHRRQILKTAGIVLSCALVFMLTAARNSGAAGYYMERPKLGLGFSYEFDAEKRTGPDINTNDSFHEFRQLADIQTRGWLYHPAFMNYTLEFQPVLSQRIEEHEEADDSRKSRSVFLPAYFADITFLPLKPYTLRLFGKRYEDTTTSAFAATTDTDTDIYGADLIFKNRTLPTTISYARSSVDQSGFFDSDTDQDDFSITTRHQKGRSDTKAYSVYNDSERTTEGTTTRTKTSNSEIRNLFDFTAKRKITLDSSLIYRWSDQDPRTTSNFRWQEKLDWRHKRNLSSSYRLGYREEDTEDFNRRTTFFGGHLRHLLYENLTTTVDADAELNDFTGGSEDIYNPRIDFIYRRRIPWGWLNLNTGYDYRVTLREGGEVAVQITNESHVLTTGVMTLLDNPNVDPGSIVVTDVTGTIVYVEDTDYTIQQVGADTQINRTTFGGIADGQTVLVDYRFLSNSDFDDALLGQNYSVDFYLWSALRLFYGFNKVDQDVLSGIAPPESRVDDTRHTAQLRYNLGWTDTLIRFNDIDRESGVSTRSWQAKQTFAFRPTSRLSFGLSGYFGQTEFSDGNRIQDQYGSRLDATWAPARWCRLRAEAYQNTIDGAGEDTVESVATASLDLFYRIWRGKVFYRFLDQDNRVQNQRRRKHTVFVEVLRLRF